ncbi:hypothetical protein D3C78_1330990 [compost metagenome]
MQLGQQRQEQLLAHGPGRVQRHRLVDQVIDLALGQLRHRQHQGMALTLPVILRHLGGFARWLRRVQQRLDLTHRNATVDPGENAQDPLHMLGIEQSVALGRAVRHDQTIATLPGAQCDGVDTGLPGDLAYGQPALRQGLGKVDPQVFAGAGVGFVLHQIAFRKLRFSGCGCR